MCQVRDQHNYVLFNYTGNYISKNLRWTGTGDIEDATRNIHVRRRFLWAIARETIILAVWESKLRVSDVEATTRRRSRHPVHVSLHQTQWALTMRDFRAISRAASCFWFIAEFWRYRFTASSQIRHVPHSKNISELPHYVPVHLRASNQQIMIFYQPFNLKQDCGTYSKEMCGSYTYVIKVRISAYNTPFGFLDYRPAWCV